MDYYGDILDYLEIYLAKTKDGNLKITQTQLIDHIIAEVGVDIIIIIKPTQESYNKLIC